MHRREWLKRAGAGTVSVIGSSAANSDVVESYEQTVHNLVGNDVVIDDERVELHVPKNAANGAVVPVGVISNVPATEKIVLFVSAHERSKVAEMDITNPALLPKLSTHLQLTSPATVTAFVKAGRQWFRASSTVAHLGENCETRESQ